MRALLLIIPVIVALATAAHAQTLMTFGGGAGQVTLPAHYERVDDPDASLVVVSRPEGNVRLYFDPHKLDADVRIPNPREDLVRQQAESKQKELRRRGDKVAFFDPSGSVLQDGRTCSTCIGRSALGRPWWSFRHMYRGMHVTLQT